MTFWACLCINKSVACFLFTQAVRAGPGRLRDVQRGPTPASAVQRRAQHLPPDVAGENMPAAGH